MKKDQLANLLLNKYGQTFSSVKVKGIDVTAAMVRNDFTPWLMFYKNRDDDPHALSGTDGELDIKCGSLSALLLKVPVFFKPSLTTDSGWVGIMLSAENDRTITDLISTAWRSQGRGPQPVKYINLTDQADETDGYQPEFITNRPHNGQQEPEVMIPLQLRKMKESYNYQIPLAQRQEVNFFRQGQMVSDYDDDYDGFAELYRNLPDYHGLTNAQLRTYFALRAQWRADQFPEFRPGMGGYLTLYMSELVNTIGCESPTAAFDQLQKFTRHYRDHFGPGARPKLFLQEMVLYYGLDHHRAAGVFRQELANDKHLHVLLHPEKYSAQELFSEFQAATTAYQSCQLYKKDSQRFVSIFKLIWQRLLQQPDYDFVGTEMAALPTVAGGEFFTGLIFDDRIHDARVYQLDSLRGYQIDGRHYHSTEVAEYAPRKSALKKLFREIDRATRIAFQIGRSLKAKEVPPAIKTAIKQGLADYQKQQKEARLKKVPIHLNDLDQIRDDAAETQEQLLTSEEVDDKPVEEPAEPVMKEPAPVEEVAEPDGDGDLPDLSEAEWFFLGALVSHQPYQDYLKKHFLMASLVADSVNDKLMDEIGDTVIEFNEDDQPQIIEDYLADVKRLLAEKEE